MLPAKFLGTGATTGKNAIQVSVQMPLAHQDVFLLSFTVLLILYCVLTSSDIALILGKSPTKALKEAGSMFTPILGASRACETYCNKYVRASFC